MSDDGRARRAAGMPGPVDSLIGFYRARLDDEPDSADMRSKPAILDDYARH